MRKLLLAVALIQMGCAGIDLKAHAFEKQQAMAGPDQDIVNFKICHGESDDFVRAYIVDQRGGSTAIATEMIVRGKSYAESHPGQCPCYKKCVPSQ